MEFFNSAVETLQTLVVALGGALCVWGGINLLEGYGSDNPGAKSQGVKQLVAGGGVALIGITLIPLLSGLVPILTVLGVELVLSFLSMRSLRLRRLLCGKPGTVTAAALCQGIQLPPGGFHGLLNALHQDLMLLLHALQPQHRIFCAAQLIPGGGDLEFHLLGLAASLLEFRLPNQLLLLQLLFPGSELFQFVGP